MCAVEASSSTSSERLLLELFDGAVDPDKVAAACSEAIEWDDVTATAPAIGRSAVRELLAAKFPPGSQLKVTFVSP